ncbi:MULTISPECIES: RNA polymerase factor sigma-54 [unclassified Neptuniibacter]|uniref:RNA polymerase factor sigma-54 n=1 Tax=unclassified Neptuniibacter TaxID=2630693 RepID=UPI000C3F823C|nr:MULTISPECIES: RNA polymerase factor sigma-54 [unclassified Neptuniibacter]MAY42332.1 RNA polymerase factor sigma-54 [Oceanospirillaceae bacterium]|tara:strand:- start:22108 stop:23610 length:1503 start_codon:yes stop_codon:yes gene_type:complete
MKQALHLKIGQQLTMTPQLQQAIRLLQLSTLDLQQEIQEALESNPMLDASEDEQPSNPLEQENNSQSPEVTSEAPATATADTDENATPEDNWNESIPDELSTDSSWEDTYQSSGPASSQSKEDFDSFESNDSSEETLQDHLHWQLNLTPMSDIDRLIATNIIDGINPDGYLTITLEEILDHFHAQTGEQFEEIELDEIEAVLHRIQQFDPAGVACKDLGDCLSIQLQQLPPETEWKAEAIKVVQQYIKLLGTHDYRQLMRKTRLKEAQLQQVIQLIQTLNPKPGASISSSTAEYVIPDVIVTKQQGTWTVNLNPEVSPKLRINSGYAGLVKRADNSADNTYLKNHLQEARWFIKSLQSRNETLLKVSNEIVKRQAGFLDHGEEGMKPMVLHDIAEAVEMHESTISRVTTQKYMHTHRGIFELKYFFSSHVSTATGGAASSTAIRALIKKMVAAENSTKPLSDNKIAQFLDEQGFKVARRTIAKYREAMGIPPSNERKRLV